MSIKDTALSAGPRPGASRAVGKHFAGDLRRALLDAAVATLDEVGADGLSLRGGARRARGSHAAPAHPLAPPRPGCSPPSRPRALACWSPTWPTLSRAAPSGPLTSYLRLAARTRNSLRRTLAGSR